MADNSFWNQNEGNERFKTIDTEEDTSLKIKMPGENSKFVPISRFQVKKKYFDEIGPRLLIILDEVAELFQASGVKSEEGKEEDAMKTEIQMIVQSITQLGRSAGIHMALATQRNGTQVLNGTIQNNCLETSTPVVINSPQDILEAIEDGKI